MPLGKQAERNRHHQFLYVAICLGHLSLFSEVMPLLRWFFSTFCWVSSFSRWIPACYCFLVGIILRTFKISLSNFQMIDYAFALLRTPSLVMNSLHLMYRSLHNHLVYKCTTFCYIVFSSAFQANRKAQLLLKIIIFCLYLYHLTSKCRGLVFSPHFRPTEKH